MKIKFLRIFKAAFIVFVLSIIIVYSLFYLFEIEKKVIYSPSCITLSFLKSIQAKSDLKSFKTANNQSISYIEINGSNDLPVIVYCHGNSKNASQFQDRIEFIANKNYRIFMPDYRGYGKSTGKPDEKGLYNDLESFIAYLNAEYDIKPENIIVWGHSLGGAVVADVSTRHKFKGIILEGTFTKMADMRKFGAKFHSKTQVEYFLRSILYSIMPITQKFDTINKVKNIKSPILIIHSKPDSIVPYSMSENLAKGNKNARLYLSETGSHGDAVWNNKEILNFIKQL